MSGAQMQGAACTYADRYAFKNAFGIVTKGDDTDAVRPEGEQGRGKSRDPIRQPQEKRDPFGGSPLPKEDAIPVAHEVKKELSEYEKGIHYLTATETAPNKQVVMLFTENENLDYTHELGQAKDKPEELAKILADIIETGKKRRAAVKGEK
jgi:hypothetical protein